MKLVRDAAFAVDPPGPGAWSLSASVSTGIWPTLAGSLHISTREFLQRFSAAGNALRKLAAGGADVWKEIDRATVVAELRDRIRDPGIISQNPTDLCGPLAVVVEFARRDPARYVAAAAELLAKGTLTTPSGEVIEADEDLRERPVPSGAIGVVDWLLAATMRDDANVFEDVDDGQGLEGLTLWGAMSDWTHDVLNLNSHWETCFQWGELEALLMAQEAIDAGGTAFLLIDANLIKNGGDDHEEDVRFRRRDHDARKPVGSPGAWTHSKDDNFPPDHWVVYLGGLTPSNPTEDDQITLRLWSWGGEYEISGTADSFGEYLYAVVTGKP